MLALIQVRATLLHPHPQPFSHLWEKGAVLFLNLVPLGQGPSYDFTHGKNFKAQVQRAYLLIIIPTDMLHGVGF